MDKQPGLGVMIKMLSSNSDAADAVNAVLGKKITSLSMVEDALHIVVADGTHVRLWDDGQSCCERRYMMTDDDLSYFVGATLEKMELRDGPTEKDEYGDSHETQFLIITTSLGVFTMVSHNEHNGYYGGFAIEGEILARAA